MKVASFFSGIGGLDLGLEQAGMKVIFQSEINEFCRKVLVKNWPHVSLHGDIRSVKINDIPNADLWCGGFPCQDVSLANQGKRRGLNGDRSGLFFTFAKLVSKKLPRWIILENVVGLLNSNEGSDFKDVLSTLDELGYVCAWRVLDAQYFRTPQRRRRVFLVASLRNNSAPQVLLDPPTIEEVSSQSSRNGTSNSKRHEEDNTQSNIISIQHGCIGRKPDAGPAGKGWRADKKTWTLDSRGSSDVVCSKMHPFGIREISRVPKELDSHRFRALGNAVQVSMAKWIGNRIMQIEFKNAPSLRSRKTSI